MKSEYRSLILMFVILIVVMCCQSCGTMDKATRKLRKAERLTKEAIALGAKVDEQADTIIKWKEIEAPPVRIDTVLKYGVDTLTVVKDSIVYKILINEKTKEVYLHTNSKPRYFKVKETLYINKTTTIRAGKTQLQYVWGIVSGLIIGLIVGAILSKLLWR